jgi:WD40 repeat protein
MRLRHCLQAACVLVLLQVTVSAQEAAPPVLPPGDDFPVLRLDAGGPLSYVSAATFSPDGRTLYTAGWDKVVQVWRLRDGRFVHDSQSAIRIPVGAGGDGGINAIALSPDGRWLAIAGRSLARNTAGLRQPGWIWPASVMSNDMRLDQGMIYVFNTATREMRLLRGHRGPIYSMAFAPAVAGVPHRLVAAAEEWNDESYVGRVRVWNLENGRQITQMGGLPAPTWRPDISVHATGNRLNQLRVALAWGDDKFRIWDIGLNQLSTSDFASLPVTASFLPGAEQHIAAGVVGEVGLWTIPTRPGGQLVVLNRGQHFSRAMQLDPREGPLAVSLLASQPGGRRDHGAFVVVHAADSSYHLQIVDLQRKRTVASQMLWQGPLKQPTVASDPTGRFVAVAGNESNEILVFAAQDLLAGRAVPQRLHGIGSTMRSVVFVRNGDDLGLALNETAPQVVGSPRRELQPQDLIFDITNRDLSGDRAGWRPVAPPAEDWSIVHQAPEDNRGSRLVISRAGRAVREIDLDADQHLTDFALCPPTDHCPHPLIAAAVHVRGEPVLTIYNAETGEELRRFTGHTERIRSLAFSDDGRLLASVAEDRTVCVWWLVDLTKTLGQYGLLQGVRLVDRNGRLVVAESKKPAMQTGDVLLGAIEDGSLREFVLASDFYTYIVSKKPGDTVTVRLQRDGRRLPDAPITVDQAIDERKPLFSLFLTRDQDRAGRWQWIGWHPTGPYDSSGQEVENHLGWHFNTGAAEAPTRFAAAGEYREQNFRRGLLAELVEKGKVPLPELPMPQMSLFFIRPNDGVPLSPNYDGFIAVQSPQVDAVVKVADMPAGSIDSLSWQLDDGEFRELPRSRTSEMEWIADLSQVSWAKGLHRVRIKLRTRDVHPREFFIGEDVHYQPPPPTVTSEMPELVSQIEADIDVTAAVRDVREPVQVTLIHRLAGRELSKREWAVDKDFDLKEAATLQPGVNEFEVTARHRNALEGFEPFETASLTRAVKFDPTRAAPDLSFAAVVPLADAGAGDVDPLKIQADRSVVVEAPRIRVDGEATGPAALKLLEFYRDDDAEGTPLTGFQPNQDMSFKIAEEFALKPGSQQIRFRAVTAAEAESEGRLQVHYQPQLPQVGNIVLKRYENEAAAKLEHRDLPAHVVYGYYHKPQIRLDAELFPAADPQPFQATVVVNGQQLPDAPVRIDPETGTLTVLLPLKPGENRIQIRLHNEWQAVRVTEAVRVTYSRPPRLAQIEAPEKVETPLLEDLKFQVQSPAELPLQRVQLLVNGKSVDRSQVRFEPVNDDKTQWQVETARISIDSTQKEHEIRVVAWNRDGASLEPGRHRLTYEPPLPPPHPPKITLISPARDMTVSNPNLTVQFRVESPSDLEKVELIFGEERISVGQNVPVQDGGETFDFPHEIELQPGLNLVSVEAVNEGGAQRTEAIEVRLIDEPVSVAIDRLVPRNDPTNPLLPQSTENGLTFSEPIADGYVTLHGHVNKPARRDKRFDDLNFVKVFVNGFLQQVVPLPDTPRPEFQADIVLNLEKNNRIELELPLPVAADSRPGFVVDCYTPVRSQRLHLLIVVVNQNEPAKIIDKLQEGLEMTTDAETGITSSPRFAQVISEDYGPLTGWVTPGKVKFQLERIRQSIDLQRGVRHRSGQEVVNDVIMIYYRGKEVITPAGEFYLATSDNWKDPQSDGSAITRSYLQQFFSRTRGAHVVWMDLVGDRPKGKVAMEWSRNPYLGVFRVAFLGEEEPPEEERLISSFREAAQDSHQLRQFKDRVEDRYIQARDRLPMMSDLHVGVLGNLELKVGPVTPE